MKTVLQLMQSMAIHVNGDTSVPEAESDEYNLWLEALNQTQDDWADVDYNWPTLRTTLNTTLLLSGTSVGLPDSFRKLDGYPMIGGTAYPEVRPEEVSRFASSDAFVTIDYPGRFMAVYPASATLSAVAVPMYIRPTSLATTTATSLCPSDNFLIYGAVEKILFSRDDGKYADFASKKDVALNRMIGSDVHEGEQMDTRVKSKQELHGFIMGQN